MFTPKGFRARAISLVGLPYVLGAEWKSGDPKALDCSELVEGLFRENGTPIGDLAAAQYDKTKSIGKGSPRVGDLVFLKNNPSRWNKVGHVAVITAKLSNGDWEIVEARGRAAGVVRTTLSYWKKRKGFTGVRRFPDFKLAPEPVVVPPTPPVKEKPKFPLPLKWYFGPKNGPKESVSGYYNRKFNGKPDSVWLKMWQAEAKNQGYVVDATGEYDRNTMIAAQEFQKDVGLSGSGRIGVKTWTKLFERAK